MASIRRIIHPTDFSPASSAAFRKAVELAKENRATLPIVHVLPTLPMVGDAYMAASAYDEMLRAHRLQAEKEMDRLLKRARAVGVRATGHVLDFGPVVESIVRFAKRQRADLIVMGTHGHGVVAKVLLGSVAERVISRAPCPVMTLKGR
ncbi:MAG TPA: universal stress protein [Methylomirabilota bacterium]|nr:universal stress protein [Methylomirabilota bacterium]